jgi:hypothetical protein
MNAWWWFARQVIRFRPVKPSLIRPAQKGIQREALGPGRYFFLPWTVELKREPLTLISAGDPG